MTKLVKLAGPAIVAGGVLVIVALQFNLGIGAVYVLGVLLLVLGVAAQWIGMRRQRPVGQPPALHTDAPVSGRCRGLNSPASKVPSHMQGYAQTYAIEVTYEPADAEPRKLDAYWPFMRQPSYYPSYGQPVSRPSTAWWYAPTTRSATTSHACPGLARCTCLSRAGSAVSAGRATSLAITCSSEQTMGSWPSWPTRGTGLFPSPGSSTNVTYRRRDKS